MNEDPAEPAATRPAFHGVPGEAFTLATAVRTLLDTSVQADVSPAERAAVATELRDLTARLNAQQRPDPFWFISHEDGTFEHLTQAATGRLNPGALAGSWLAPDGQEEGSAAPHPETGEVLARYEFGRTHAIAKDLVSSGSIALLLDHILSFATAAVDRGGMTVALEIRCHAATPYEVPLLIRARYTHSEGRKHFATGEIVLNDVVTASARGVFISNRRPEPAR